MILGIWLGSTVSVCAAGPPAVGDEAALLAVLQSTASVFDKAKACQQLAVTGTKNAVPVLAQLLADDQLSHYARFALEPLPDPRWTRPCASLKQLQGGLLVGVVNWIGMRRDQQAVDALQALTHSDVAVAGAAACALAASLRPPRSTS